MDSKGFDYFLLFDLINIYLQLKGNIRKYKMYIVYSDIDSQKKFLEEQFLFQSGCFAVPFTGVKSLHDLIGKTCFQFYQHNQSIFIQKLKSFISGLINLTFSFPLLRQLLSVSKKKDLALQFYRNHFMAINNIFCGGQEQCQMFGIEDCNSSVSMIGQQLQQTHLSYKTLETFEMDNEPLITLQTWSQSQQLAVPKSHILISDEKTSILHSDQTADQTYEQFYQSNQVHKKLTSSHADKQCSTLTASLKLQKCFQNNILAAFDKNIDKLKYTMSDKMDESVQQFINSFKKQRGNGVVQMIINQESLGKIARKQNKQHRDRRRLEDQLIEKTKSQKSTDYNRNIKTILLNKKLKEKKSKQRNESKSKQKQPNPQINMKKKKLSNVMSAGDLRVNIHEPIALINIEGDFSFARPIPNK